MFNLLVVGLLVSLVYLNDHPALDVPLWLSCGLSLAGFVVILFG